MLPIILVATVICFIYLNNNFIPSFLTIKKKIDINALFITLYNKLFNLISNWILSTNHKKIAVMYFVFVVITGFTGLILAMIIRIELAYPGQCILINNAEKYLTIISLHGIVMVFFVVIPTIFGAFGNFLLPTQLGIRDVAFPRLNSFMFWITPSGFILLLYIILFDKSYNLTY
jgi:heme/copper-type cytochrome/quinol oxidase subunit 1